MKRRALIGTIGVTLGTAGTGCLSSIDSLQPPRVHRAIHAYEESSHLTSLAPSADIGTVTAAVFTDPDEADREVQWTGLTRSQGTGPPSDVDFDTEFISMVVAVLNPDQRLQQRSDPTIGTGIVRYTYSITEAETQHHPSREKYYLYYIHVWRAHGAHPTDATIEITPGQ